MKTHVCKYYEGFPKYSITDAATDGEDNPGAPDSPKQYDIPDEDWNVLQEVNRVVERIHKLRDDVGSALYAELPDNYKKAMGALRSALS